jgi:hypothetical protein
MGITEYLVVIGFAIGFVKYQLDVADKHDKRMDKLEKDQIVISQRVDAFAIQSFHSLESQEGRLNMILTNQESFMEKVLCRYEKLEEKKNE